MWRELITGLSDELTVTGPASEAAIADCARTLGDELPAELLALLRETDGVLDEFDGGLVWPVAKIAADNADFRSDVDFAELYLPFDGLLFFGDDGGGDLFAFVLRGQGTQIFRWDHETDSRFWVAPRLERFLRERVSGELA